MQLFVETQPDVPIVDLKIVFHHGATTDPLGIEGLARHSVALMRRGTRHRTRRDIDAALDGIGATLQAEVSPDQATLSAHCLTRHVNALVEILADVLQNPTFPADEHEKLRRESLALLDEIRDDDAMLCARFFERFALKGHPYGRTALGTKESLERVTAFAAKDWVAKHLRTEHMAVGFAGDVAASQAEQVMTQLVRGLPLEATREAPAALLVPPFAPHRRTYLIDKPQRTQTQIYIGHLAPPARDPDWLRLHVAATALGGMFTSRLMTEVRVKRGWSYGASARVARSRSGHTFRIRVFPSLEQTPDALALVLSLWEEFTAEGLHADEFVHARSFLEGSFAFEIDTAEKRLGHHLETWALDLPEDYYPTYVERLKAMSRDEVNDAISRWFRPQNATIIITCTADSLLSRLSNIELGDVQVVAYDSY